MREREKKPCSEKTKNQKRRDQNKRKVTLPNEWIIRPRIDFDKLPMVRPFTRFGSVDHDVVSVSVSDPTPGYSSPFGCDRVGVTFRMSLYLPLYHNKSLTHTLEQGATKKKQRRRRRRAAYFCRRESRRPRDSRDLLSIVFHHGVIIAYMLPRRVNQV